MPEQASPLSKLFPNLLFSAMFAWKFTRARKSQSAVGQEDGGKITLDGIDVSTIPPTEVRKRLACVTQNPFIFNGSVRENLDPLGRYFGDDGALITALRKVDLWDVIFDKAGRWPEAAALDMRLHGMDDLDSLSLSQGQRQLLCLARALLHPSPIILLDEPSSSVDSATESRILDVIQCQLAQRTIVTVTHSMQGIMGFDKVAVMSHGQLVEFGPPRELLDRKDSALTALYSAK
ncbi:hypothetical protein N0V82_003063 [Gnomoniopsis sp. IMI 355080]|nr:hypothetical protein N0V82_003063 [Gnomoniopsis sp. IMI 355080]